ncbi:hypothetical protein BN1708_014287, partial [Verticillium longisporum]
MPPLPSGFAIVSSTAETEH